MKTAAINRPVLYSLLKEFQSCWWMKSIANRHRFSDPKAAETAHDLTDNPAKRPHPYFTASQPNGRCSVAIEIHHDHGEEGREGFVLRLAMDHVPPESVRSLLSQDRVGLLSGLTLWFPFDNDNKHAMLEYVADFVVEFFCDFCGWEHESVLEAASKIQYRLKARDKARSSGSTRTSR